MGSSQRVIPQEELNAGFGLIKDIIAIIKDPEGFEEAHKAAREQTALTEEEKNKVIEARAFYSDADEKAAEYRVREDAIFSGEDELNRKKEEHKQHVTNEEIRLSDLESTLNSAASDLKNGQQKLESDKQTLERLKGELLAEHNRKLTELSEKIADVESSKKTLQEEARATAVARERIDNKEAEMLRLVTGK